MGGSKKALDNHRTEIAGKLFGMYFFDQNNIVYSSERTLKFLKNEDQPDFFKDICLKFQFPNGMDSVNNILKKTSENISIRQFSFILELLIIAHSQEQNIRKNEIAYFVLNSLMVLQGKISPSQVYETIMQYRLNKINVKVQEEDKASSFSMQHINEQINLLELANLIRIDREVIFLNPYERKAIDYIRRFWNQPLKFNIYKYRLMSIEDRKKVLFDWQIYFSQIDKGGVNVFTTSIDAIQFNVMEDVKNKTDIQKIDKIKIGDDGENFVYLHEKERVGKYDRRLVNKVLLLGKTKGLGYDIQSIYADDSSKSEFVQYIEVKSTKRVTEPSMRDDGWIDAITLTRNEWVAAEQHTESFSLYRVYFTPKKIIVYVIKNPFQKNTTGSIKCTPINYRLDFSTHAIDLTFEAI